MAQRVQVLLVCDMHGDDSTPGEETISFGLDGTSYEIDVCGQHAAGLRDSFAPFVGQARRAGGGRSGGAGRSGGGRGGRGSARARGGGDRARTAEIRQWARDNGHQVPDRGRLPASIVEEYEAAH